ncbi:MAG: bifunctional 4-hydroxy-2-oxoglutarate aldolase/2-dehydro-3-deoxy-phosphogluconate aldolase [Lawsonibacter sp.]
MDALNIIQAHGIIPVLGLTRPETAPMVAAALRKGGLPLLEVTMRAERAMDCLKAIKATDSDTLVGAGTILHPEQVDQAKQAGADFIVTPGFNPKVVTHCLELGLPVVPGCVTPTEIEAGLELGLNVFKFFPSEPLNGMATIRQLCGPYGNIRFIPTAGITLTNLEQYLSSDKIAAVGGSFMAPAALVEAQDWAGITALCQSAVEKSLGFSLAHIGINGENKEEGLATARWFFDRFGFPVKEGGKSNFAASYVECCNQKFPGKYGHIGIFTLSPERAVAYFQSKGIPMREEFKNVDAKGNLVAVYLAEEIGGFAVHVVKKP